MFSKFEKTFEVTHHQKLYKNFFVLTLMLLQSSGNILHTVICLSIVIRIIKKELLETTLPAALYSKQFLFLLFYLSFVFVYYFPMRNNILLSCLDSHWIMQASKTISIKKIAFNDVGVDWSDCYMLKDVAHYIILYC